MVTTTEGSLGTAVKTNQDAFDAVARAKQKDIVFATGGLVVMAIAMTLLLSLIGDLVIRGAGRISYDFMTSYPSRLPERAGILSAWVGSLLVMLVTAFLAIPIGIGAGLYLEEYAKKGWLSNFIEINVSNLAGVPSIIYGLLALGLFVYGFNLGKTILVAGMTLALLILPIVIVSTREAVRSIPLIIKEGAYGLGADQWQVMWNYIIPAARPGILSAWVGTLYVMLVTAFLAIPIGVGAGLYLEEYAKKGWVSNFIEVNVSNLAGVPSIIYGLLALGLFVYGFNFGKTILVAGMTLALLILPIVIVSTREAVRSIPKIIKEGAYGLGADQWQVMWNYIIPAARPGILTGAIVGLSRAIGETAPIITIGALTFIAFLPPPPVSGEFPFLSFAWLNEGFTVLPIQMFNWTSRPQADFHTIAASTGVVLIALTFSLNGIAIWIRYRLRMGYRN